MSLARNALGELSLKQKTLSLLGHSLERVKISFSSPCQALLQALVATCLPHPPHPHLMYTWAWSTLYLSPLAELLHAESSHHCMCISTLFSKLCSTVVMPDSKVHPEKVPQQSGKSTGIIRVPSTRWQQEPYPVQQG